MTSVLSMESPPFRPRGDSGVGDGGVVVVVGGGGGGGGGGGAIPASSSSSSSAPPAAVAQIPAALGGTHQKYDRSSHAGSRGSSPLVSSSHGSESGSGSGGDVGVYSNAVRSYSFQTPNG